MVDGKILFKKTVEDIEYKVVTSKNDVLYLYMNNLLVGCGSMYDLFDGLPTKKYVDKCK